MSQALPPDLMAALSGGGSGSSSPSLPPDIAALVGGGSSAADSSGSSPDQGGGSDPQAAVGYINDVVDLLKKYVDVEPDQEDVAVAMTCLQNLQKLQAKDQKEADGAMQGKMTPRLMRKAASGPAAQ